MILRRNLLAAVFFLYLLASSHSLDFPNRKHKIEGPIKTIVVIVMENRSFDHVLGWLKKTRPEIDGLTGKESNRINASDPNSPEVFVSDDAVFIDSDPGHSIQAIREQIFGSNDSSAEPNMSGFAQQANSMEVDGMAKTVMSGFKPELLPIYTELANEFAVMDRWFASVPASTQPNRFYVHSATSHGASSNVRKDLIHGFPQKTIFDSLDENGLTFGIYFQNIPATLFFKSLRKLKHITKFHDYQLKFKSHARKGKLPNYVVLEQRYFDVKLSPANDDHPSHDVAIGQRFVKEVYEILRASPQWKEMALLITYDEHGGFYDHVPTPVSGVPNPDGIIGPDPFYFRFDRLGVRVPTFLISPWVEKGTVIHEPSGPTPDSQFEHSSIPATVKKLFNLKSNFLTKRDEWAVTFEDYFYLRKTPRDDCPDIVALAARDAVSFQFNQSRWVVETGRRDGIVSLESEALADIPSPFSNFSTLQQDFANKNLSVHDLVVLLGTHTIGVGHCNLFSSMLYNFIGKGNSDPSLNPAYVAFLKTKCKSLSDTTTTIPMNPGSSTTFDNQYYTILKLNESLFQSDAALLTDKIASAVVDDNELISFS